MALKHPERPPNPPVADADFDRQDSGVDQGIVDGLLRDAHCDRENVARLDALSDFSGASSIEFRPTNSVGIEVIEYASTVVIRPPPGSRLGGRGVENYIRR